MAVYTHVSDDQITNFLADYRLGTVTDFKEIAEGIENSNFYLVTSMGKYILTLFEKRTDAGDLPFFIQLMDHLSSSGIACPKSVVNQFGDALGGLCGRPALIVSFLPGRPVNDVTVDCVQQLGQRLASMHMATMNFKKTRINNLSLSGWHDMFGRIKDRADEIQPGIAAYIIDELSWLDQNWPENLTRGIIHGDLFPDNVFFDDGCLSGFIDFYFACDDVLVYDLAVCINAWCFEQNGTFNKMLAAKLLAGYESARPLDEREFNALNACLRGSAMRFLLTRMYDALNPVEQALVAPKDPIEFWRILDFHKNNTNWERS